MVVLDMVKGSIKTRSSARDLPSLHLTAGMIVLVIAGLLFALVAADVVNGGGLTSVDVQLALWLHEHSRPLLSQCLLALWLHEHSRPLLSQCLLALTHVHDPIVISVVSVLITVYLIWKKRWYAALAALLVIQGGMLLNLLVKQVFHRARPSFENPLVTLTTYSFPSGHVVASTVFYGVLAVLLISQTTSWVRACCVALTALLMIVLIAFSRMYLGAHYLSDVLAGLLEAIAWLALCLTTIQAYRDYRQADG
jgi:membrane-associated phospholipid phosphatase